MDFNSKKYTEIVNSFFGAEQTPKNQRLFYQWLLDDNDSEQKELAMQYQFDSYNVAYDARVEEMLLQVHEKIGVAITATTLTKRVSINRWAMRVAAALIPLIMIAGATFFLLNRPSSIYPSIEFLTFHAPVSETKKVILSCNSHVWLKDGSSIVYARTNSGNREITLSGKAHFAVERNEERPFLVTTDHLQIAVLGTEFTIKEIAGTGNTLVTLTSGSLSVESPTGEQFLLHPGDQLTHNHQTGSSLVSQLDAFDLSLMDIWREERLVFQQATLSEIIRTINAYYFNRAIDFSALSQINENLYSIRFSVGESLETTLHILRELTGGFNYRMEGSNIYIYN